MTILFIIICPIGILLLPYWLIRARPFPQPSGQWKVGVADLIWDAPERQGIIAKIWYPTTDRDGISSPYIDRIERTLAAITAGMNPVFRSIAKLYFGRVVTPSFIDATPMQLAGGCPVVLFSPGFRSINFLNTFYALEFASHGFMAIGINHPGISAGTLLTDGSQVELETIDVELAFAQYEQPDSLFSQIVVRQADNLSSIVNKIIDLNNTIGSCLYENIDPCKIFAAGHSIGGAASFVACGEDSRIAKGVNLDEIFVNPVETNYGAKELLLISADREKYRPNDDTQSRYYLIMSKHKIQREQLALKTNLKQLSFVETKHFDFRDLALFIRPSIGKRIGFVGRMGGLKFLLATSRAMMGFFNE